MFNRAIALPNATAEREPKTTLWFLAVASLPILSALIFNLVAPEDLDPTLRILASATWILAWLPTLLHLLSESSQLPFMPFLGFVYGVYYSAVIFLRGQLSMPQSRLSISDSLIIRSELMVFLGMACLFLGYYSVQERSLKILPRMEFPHDMSRAANFIVVMGVFSLIFARLPDIVAVTLQFSSVLTLFRLLTSYSIAFLFYYQLRGKLPLIPKLALWGFLLPTRLMESLTSGGVSHLVVDFAILGGVYWLARHKIPWKTGLLFILLTIPLLGVKGDYRQIVWYGEGVDYSAFKKAEVFTQLIVDGIRYKDGFLTDCYQTALARVDQTSTLAAIVYFTPDVIPYWQGESYITLLWALVPRFLYPDKPLKNLGQDFGHRYGLLASADRATSWNFPQLVELYANFGPWGVGIGMFLIGVVCRVTYGMFVFPGTSEMNLICGVVILTGLFNIESDFSLIYGGLVLSIAAIYSVLGLAKMRSIRMPKGALEWR